MTDKELEKIYNEAYKAVYWTAMALLKNEADAEDIVQDTFVTLIESYDSIKDKSKVMPWLKKIAANKCLDRIKLAKTDTVEDEFFEDVEAVPEDFLPDMIVESAEMRKIIMDIIERSLSDDIRRTLILFYFDEMSTKEIAETLGVPEGTVRRRLNFARNKIKKEVEKYEEENKTKLFGMAALPFLSKLFIKEAEQVPFKVMPASLTTTLSASAQASTQGAGINVAASAAKKGTGIIMKKFIIGGIAAVVAVGVVTGIIISVLTKKADTKPETVKESSIEASEDDLDSGKEKDATDLTAGSAVETGIVGFAATGKMTTEYGDYYLKETLGEFVGQFSSGDFKVIIFDADNNTYTIDDLDTVVTTDWVGVNIKHGVTFVCEITAEKIDGVKLRDCRITDFITKEGTTSVEINNITVKLGETTKDDLISFYGNYESKDEESFGYIRFNLSEYELNSYSYKLNDDNTIRFITVDASPFI